jgi:hypothetical protein
MSPLFKPVVNKAIDFESSGDEEEENFTAATTLHETTRLLPAVRQLSTRFGTLLKLAPGTLFITVSPSFQTLVLLNTQTHTHTYTHKHTPEHTNIDIHT